MKIHYVVSVYIGNRLTKSVNDLIKKDPYHYIKKHLECLSKFEVPDISKITFVISLNDSAIDNNAKDVINDFSFSIPIDFIVRENLGMSYAGWNEIINHSIDNGEDYDYFFLIEDDYVPNEDYFYKYFINKCTDKTFFVAQKYMNFDINPHPAVSNGLLRYDLAKETKKRFKNVFKVETKDDNYSLGVQNQVNYLKNGQSMGYHFSDVESNTFIPFLDRTKFTFYGKLGNPIPIVPECSLNWIRAFKDQKICFKFKNGNDYTEEEPAINVFNQIRKIRTLYKNKDNRNFTIEESNVFYTKNLKDLYVFYDSNEIDIFGYCIIKSVKDKIFVSPKLSFHYIKGDNDYVSKFYNFLIDYLETNEINEIYTETLAENSRLINQITNLGFILYETLETTKIYKYVHT